MQCDPTVGPRSDPAELEPSPENAHVERYISQSLVLPLASVAVAHGGSGSTLAALAHGLPMLVVPQGADQFENAQQCVAIGVGKLLLPHELTAQAAREAVVSLLEDDLHRESAQRLAREIAAMPEPAALVPKLVATALQAR